MSDVVLRRQHDVMRRRRHSVRNPHLQTFGMAYSNFPKASAKACHPANSCTTSFNKLTKIRILQLQLNFSLNFVQTIFKLFLIGLEMMWRGLAFPILIVFRRFSHREMSAFFRRFNFIFYLDFQQLDKRSYVTK